MTQPLGHNYGGIIQNYALQRVLKDMGYVPETIYRVYENNNSKLKVFLSVIKQNIYKYLLRKNIITYTEHQKTLVNNINFLKKHINLSPLIDTDEDLAAYFKKNNFDSVIVGSDQTWRPKYSPNIYNYFLDFLIDNHQIKKIAYASSFGTEKWEYTELETQRCKELAQHFDAVSVREDTGIKLCKEYLKIEAIHLLDPTLLLTAKDYSELISRPEERKELFTYVLDESEEKLEFIKKTGEKLGLKVYRNQAANYNPAVKKRLRDYIFPPLEGWLQGFRDADFVITDSFHGTVFSIINKKPFLSLVNADRGAARFESFLSELGLKDRMLYDVKAMDMNILEKEINYDTVFEKLSLLKEESINFLKENL